jgi:hypothetical protein
MRQKLRDHGDLIFWLALIALFALSVVLNTYGPTLPFDKRLLVLLSFAVIAAFGCRKGIKYDLRRLFAALRAWLTR